ncbi:DUF3987 domain-containing protein [Novosphingobium sp. HII-3]|uniref:DUF3987 domain-containing protein n=1 Tax=Novosphingobium sp. HII-3 TaxID=2075565 RepID=UPI000CDA343F|nr:DUF3987 domain-containing protein [Novosphingobium sp. HII-3]
MNNTPAAPIAQVPAMPIVPPVPKGHPEDERPVDPWGKFEPPALPMGLLPHFIERFAFALSAQMGADPAALAMSAITTCAAAIPDHVRLQVKQHDARWKESARLWTVLIGDPSSKKSPTMTAASKPLLDMDHELFATWTRQKMEWDALDRDEKKVTPPPGQVRLRLSDTTIEAAQEVFRSTTSGLLIHADELSGWFGSLDKYSGGRGASADRAFWLQAWNGGQYAVNRVSRGSILLPNLSASILGGIQPDAIRRIMADAVDDGLLQRFLPIVLRAATVGEDAPVPSDVGMYDLTVKRLPHVLAMNPLQFSPEAHEVRAAMEFRHHGLMGGEAVNRKFASHVGKLDGIFARLCIVWHVAENAWSPIPPMIPAELAERVAAFMRRFLLPHALSFYASLGLADDQDRVEAVAGYILAHGLTTVDRRTVQRGVRDCRGLSGQETRTIFETLEAMGWLTPVDDIDGRRTGSRWAVNPWSHVLFAERAEQERARRLQARASILDLSGICER